MKFEKTQLQQILGCDAATENKWIDPINKACEKFGINTRLRLAAFIAQVGHESGRLKAVTENLNYSAAGLMNTWPGRFDTFTANACARNPEKIANRVYSSRMGNGSESSGDGWKYRGRGLIQCTGKSNYDAFSQACGVNAVANPDSLAQPDNAALSAGWFWSSKGLNAYADRADFLGITKRINGGTHGQADRELLYKRALIVLAGGVLPSDATLAKKPLEVSPDSTSQISDEKTPAAKNSSIVEPRSIGGGGTSKYPWNLVTESRSGHVTEVDDTPGNERLNMTHRTGSYWEIDRLGTFTHKSILDAYKLTKGDAFDFTGGNYTQQVKGQSYRQSSGDMIFKTEGQLFMNANKVQVNTGTMAVSGEINSPTINANMFGGMGGMAFGDMLAKESLVAYDLKKGKTPMLGQSMGFRGSKDASGSADGAMDNELATKKPDGTPWITNGIKTVVGAATVAAAASAIADILKNGDHDKAVTNALTSAANAMNAKEKAESLQTPVFLKHVSFNKPTLLSQSTIINLPDPALYVNNYHTIVRSDGIGQLHMSNGREWVPVGDPGAANSYTDSKIADIVADIDDIDQRTAQQIANEALERSLAILNEAKSRNDAIVEEARVRQEAITQGLLAEAVQRQASVEAESIIRQSSDESLANHILTLTASVSNDIAAAIQTEQEARADAISAEASHRQTLAAKVDGVVSTVSDEIIARSDGDTAISSRLTQYIATNDNALANTRSEIYSEIDANNAATSARIDSVVAQTRAENDILNAMVSTESKARTDMEGALSSRIDTVLATTNHNSALIASETVARVDDITSLASRFDTLLAITNNNTAAITQEQQARSDGDSATVYQIGTLQSSTDISLAHLQDGISDVRSTAEGKAKVTRSTFAPSSPAIGDIWINITDNKNIPMAWNGSEWEDIDYRTSKNAADIVTEATARSDGDSANANLVTTLSARVNNGNSAPFEPFVSYDFTTSANGWSSIGANIATNANSITLTSTSGDPILSSPALTGVNGALYNLVRVRIKRTGGAAWQGQLYYVTPGHGHSESYTKIIEQPSPVDFASWYTLEWDMSTIPDWTNSTINSIRLDLGSSFSDVFEIDWIAIGKRGVGVPKSEFASVQTLASTTADTVGNVKAQWAVKTNVNGHVAGIALINDLIDGRPSSSFTVEADKFSIETTSGGAFTPFTVDASGVSINGQVRINTTPLSTLAQNAAEPTLTFIGSFASAPAGSKNKVYLNTSDGNSYIHNGSGWVLYLQKGANGSPGVQGPQGPQGSDGNRGSLTLYATGTSWLDSTANDAVYSVTYSYAKMIGDTVTISSGDFAKTKYWSGSAWVDPGVMIDGNLLVTKTVSAAALNVNSLSVITPNIGTLRNRTDGGRVEISDNQIRIYDINNAIRVKLGYLGG